jgi:hypothetical protein
VFFKADPSELAKSYLEKKVEKGTFKVTFAGRALVAAPPTTTLCTLVIYVLLCSGWFLPPRRHAHAQLWLSDCDSPVQCDALRLPVLHCIHHTTHAVWLRRKRQTMHHTQSAAVPFRVGTEVEVYSKSSQGWFLGRVTDTNADAQMAKVCFSHSPYLTLRAVSQMIIINRPVCCVL